MIAAATATAAAQVNEGPAGECAIYESFSYYTLGSSSSWTYSGGMGHQVCIEDGKLFINKVCGNGWTVGELNAEGTQAVFASGQEVAEDTFLMAYVSEDGVQTPIEQFCISIYDDGYELEVDKVNGNSVTLSLEYSSGYVGTRWKDLILVKWEKEAIQPAADAQSSWLQMNYRDMNGDDRTKLVEMASSDSGEIWISGIVQDGIWMQGQQLPDGDIAFESPQYMGLIANFFTYTYAVDANGHQTDSFTLMADGEGGYALDENINLYEGDEYPEYVVVYSASFKPVEYYIGSPQAPVNAQWDKDNDHYFTFDLHMLGLGGEELPEEQIYWQVLADGAPYVFSKADYPMLGWSGLADSTELPANKYFTVMTPDGMMPCGNLDGLQFGCYMPAYSAGDDIAVRCGYKIDENIFWSETVPVTEDNTVNELPAEAIYFSRVSVPMGEWEELPFEGYAAYAEFDDDTVRMSGLLFQYGWIEGTLDEKHRKATFLSGQVIGTDEFGRDIELVAASSTGYNENGTLELTPLDAFTFKIGSEGSKISMVDQTYLLSVCEGEITNVWKYTMSFTIVPEKQAEIPAGAALSEYIAEYTDRLGQQQESTVIVGREDDKVWLQGLVGPDTTVAGYSEGDDIVIPTPQFVGVVRDMVSYLTAEQTNFWDNTITLHTDDNGATYTTDNNLWLGTGVGYAWLSNMNLVLTFSKTVSINEVTADNISFENGAFTANGDVRVFNLSGMEVKNINLQNGVYVVLCNGNAYKMHVR